MYITPLELTYAGQSFWSRAGTFFVETWQPCSDDDWNFCVIRVIQYVSTFKLRSHRHPVVSDRHQGGCGSSVWEARIPISDWPISACWCYPRTHSSLRYIHHSRCLVHFIGSVSPTARCTRCGNGTGYWNWCHPTWIDQDPRAVTVLSARVPDVISSILYILHGSLVIGMSVRCGNTPYGQVRRQRYDDPKVVCSYYSYHSIDNVY
jgi:hypothetical protein